MDDEAENEHRSEQVSRAFALLTAKLEDAAGLAVEGQGRGDRDRLRALASEIAELATDAATIAGLLSVLLPYSR